MEKLFAKLLKEYSSIIDLGYSEGSSKDYTPDYMTYDYRGFSDVYNYESKEELEKLLPQLKQAVAHARKYKSWLKSSYGYTFG